MFFFMCSLESEKRQKNKEGCEQESERKGANGEKYDAN